MIFKPDQLSFTNPDWVHAMKLCDQSPVHHAEGDVWTHTLMVCEHLLKSAEYNRLDPELQNVFLGAAVLHDVSKPDTFTVDEETGKISNPHHAPKGAIKARRILWEMGVPFQTREAICNLVKFHMRPFHFINNENMESYVAEISLCVRTDLLKTLATADNLGRICNVPSDNNARLELFESYCKEIGCWGVQYPFSCEHARIAHFSDGKDIMSQCFRPLSPTVHVMSGLPASGKDHYIKSHLGKLPVISLDDLRRKHGTSPNETGIIIQLAQQQAKKYLAAKQDFVWNATNLSTMVRGKCLRLFRQYDARIHIIYVEGSKSETLARNKQREFPVPEAVIEKLLSKWEVPNLTEGHCLTFAVGGICQLL